MVADLAGASKPPAGRGYRWRDRGAGPTRRRRPPALGDPLDRTGPDRTGTPVLLALPVGAALALLPVMAAAGLAQQVGAWSPGVAVPALVVGVALAVTLLPRLPLPRLPWSTALGLLALCVGFGVWAALTHGEHVVVRRDPGAYATYALALARFGGVPLDPGLEAFSLSAADPWVRVGAAANYAVIGPPGADGQATLQVVPQFLVGVPSVLTLGWWGGGWSGLMLLPAVAAALALAAFAGLAAHLLGRWAALLALLVLALSQPVLLVARQTFSEPFSLLYVCTGALLLVLAVDLGRPTTVGRRPARGTRLTALLAGALLGANLFVRIDAARELVLLVPLLALLAGRRHPAALPVAVGAVLTGLPAALATTWWDSPYIASVASSLGPLLVAGAVLLVLSALGVVVGREVAERWARTGVPVAAQRAARLLPVAAGSVVAVVGLVLASRPLWLVDRREPYIPGQDDFVAALQSQQGLPLDGLRTYAEHSVTWLVWWLGPVTVVLALLGAAGLARAGTRAVLSHEPLPGWVVPAAIGLAVTVVSLYRPAITPDHPWADRRYVTVAYPFVVLAATLVLVRLARLRGHASAPFTGFVVVGLAVSMLVPTAAATLPMATTRTELGQVEAAEAVCDAIAAAGPRPALLTVGFRARVEWAPVVRARCGVPLVGIEPPTATPTDGTEPETLGTVLARAAEAARANGYTPVVMVGDATSAQLVADQTLVTLPQVVDLATSEPERLLEERPLGDRPLPVAAWVAELP